MPIVPTYQRQVGPAPLPGVRVNPNAPAEAFGGPDLSGVTRVAQQVADQARERADQIAVLAADNQLADLGTQLETQGLQRRGPDAMGAAAAAASQWQQQVGQLTQGLANDRQRLAVAQRASQRWAALHATLERHAAGEAQRYDAETTQAALANRVNDAVAHYADPGRVQTALDEQRAILTDYGRRAGLPPEVVQQQLQQAQSQTHTGVIDRMLANGQDLAASRYYHTVKDQVTGEDATKVERALEAGSTLGEAQRQADAIVYGAPGGPGPSQAAPKIPGLLTPGTIDLTHRPRVKNPDGSISTVRSMSFEEDGHEILVPTVTPDGKNLTEEQAIDRYHRTGEHLGIFANADAATAYAKRLHEAQAAMIEGTGDGTVPGGTAAPATGPARTLAEALERVRQIEDPKVRELTEARVRRDFAEQQQASREAQQQAYQDATNVVEQTRDVTRIAPATWATFSVGEREALRNYATSLTKGTPVETDPETFYVLKRLAASSDPKDRQRFASLNLLQYADRVSKGDLRDLISDQTGVLKGDAATEDKLGHFRTRDEIVRSTWREAGLIPDDPKDKKWEPRLAQFDRALDARLAQYERDTGKKPTSEDMQRIADDLLVRATVAGTGGWLSGKTTRRIFEAQPGERLVFSINDVPPAERQRLTQYLQAQGRPVTEKAILKLFAAMQDHTVPSGPTP